MEATKSLKSNLVGTRRIHTARMRHTPGRGLAGAVIVAVAASLTVYTIREHGGLLPVAKADERITSHAELDQTPTHCKLACSAADVRSDDLVYSSGPRH